MESVRDNASDRVSSVKGSLIVLDDRAAVLVARVGLKRWDRLDEDTFTHLVFRLDE